MLITGWNSNSSNCLDQIVATETGPGRQSASADVIVNILDLNDNAPEFDRAEYRCGVIHNIWRSQCFAYYLV